MCDEYVVNLFPLWEEKLKKMKINLPRSLRVSGPGDWDKPVTHTVLLRGSVDPWNEVTEPGLNQQAHEPPLGRPTQALGTHVSVRKKEKFS